MEPQPLFSNDAALQSLVAIAGTFLSILAAVWISGRQLKKELEEQRSLAERAALVERGTEPVLQFLGEVQHRLREMLTSPEIAREAVTRGFEVSVLPIWAPSFRIIRHLEDQGLLGDQFGWNPLAEVTVWRLRVLKYALLNVGESALLPEGESVWKPGADEYIREVVGDIQWLIGFVAQVERSSKLGGINLKEDIAQLVAMTHDARRRGAEPEALGSASHT